MADHFDPYYKWLGIPPRDQPANYYRLLSIELFESDSEVIDAAARRLAVYVKSCAVGPHQAEAKKLLSEIVAARSTLLDPKRRAAYDQQLASPPPGVPAAAASSAAEFAPRAAPDGLLPNEQPPPPPAADWGTPLSDTDLESPPPAMEPPETIGDLPSHITTVPDFAPLVKSKKSGVYKVAKPAKNAGSDVVAAGAKKPQRRKSQSTPAWVVIAAVLGVVALIGILVAVFSSPEGEAGTDSGATKVADKAAPAAAEEKAAAKPEAASDATETEAGEYEEVAGADVKRALGKPRSGAGGSSGKLAEAIAADASLQEVQQLLAGGVDPSAKDAEGRTPLRLAVIKGRADVVKALLAKKANPNAPDLRGETPLMSAAQAGNEAILKLLLDAGADPNVKSDVRLAPGKSAPVGN